MSLSSEAQSDNGQEQSPFDLPAMSDAYPLDPAERKSIDELLKELEQERKGAKAVTGAL